jgi:hypothetical protein
MFQAMSFVHSYMLLKHASASYNVGSGDAVPTLSLDCSATSVAGHRNRARVDGQANKDLCGEACCVQVRYYELVSVATAPFDNRAS